MTQFTVQNHNGGPEQSQNASTASAALTLLLTRTESRTIRGKLRIEDLGGANYAAYDDEGLLGEYTVERA